MHLGTFLYLDSVALHVQIRDECRSEVKFEIPLGPGALYDSYDFTASSSLSFVTRATSAVYGQEAMGSLFKLTTVAQGCVVRHASSTLANQHLGWLIGVNGFSLPL